MSGPFRNARANCSVEERRETETKYARDADQNGACFRGVS
jgi:hypothetical protein